MKAGKPDSLGDYEKVEQEGMEFYIKNELMNKEIQINRLGWWIFSSLAVTVK